MRRGEKDELSKDFGERQERERGSVAMLGVRKAILSRLGITLQSMHY